MNTAISTQASSFIESVKTCKGQFIRARYRTTVKTAAAHKDKKIIKNVTGVFRTGIEYSHLGKIKDAIASGERGEVGALPWGEWAARPWIIAHKGEEYVRLYPAPVQRSKSTYVIVEGDKERPLKKEEVCEYLTPAEAEKLRNPQEREIDCITKRLSDIDLLGCWTPLEPEEQEIIEQALKEVTEQA